MTSQEKRGRGRPRGFDTDEILDRALEVFWAKGFDGASIGDLVAATGLQRASLYAAFTDKETLYLRALEHYSARVEAAFEAAFAASKTPEDALEAFLISAIDIYDGDGARKGCMVSCTASAAAKEHDEIRRVLAETLERTQAGMAQAFHARGVAEPELTAEMAAALMHSMALRLRAGEPRASVEQFARRAARHLLARTG